MTTEVENKGFSIESGHIDSEFDDDGRVKRTGSWVTASAHIITAVIGSGVLSLAWTMAQLGWIAGILALIIFSCVTFFCASLLADSYRSHIDGTRNYTYMDVVKANLGGIKYKFCGLAQYGILVGTTIGYTITSSISMAAIKRSNCFHNKGHRTGCHTSNNVFMIIFGAIQIILSQVPDFHELSGLSILAAIMSFAYSFIGLGLSIARVAGRKKHLRTSITGVIIGVDVSRTQKIWNCLQAIGDIAFAYSFSMVLVEIQDTIKARPPENVTMKKATLVGIVTTTTFYLLCGTMGYIAFGNKAPGNFLTGFGFYEPYWLIDFANACIVIHLIGAYQVFGQPFFTAMETYAAKIWPESEFITKQYPIKIPLFGIYKFNVFRLVWRTVYVIITTVIAMILPFFNSVVGLLGAAAFWPLTVYFPVEMYIVRANIRRFSSRWIGLQLWSVSCLIISLLVAVGSIEGIVKDLSNFKIFTSVS